MASRAGDEILPGYLPPTRVQLLAADKYSQFNIPKLSMRCQLIGDSGQENCKVQREGPTA